MLSSRSAALMWIMDNQLARRNINDFTRNYLIGRRYIEEKKGEGRPKKLHQNDGVSETAVRIAKQVGRYASFSSTSIRTEKKEEGRPKKLYAKGSYLRIFCEDNNFHRYQ